MTAGRVSPTGRMDLAERVALVIAFGWSLLLLAGAYVVPVYDGSMSEVRNGRATSHDTAATLVEVNGASSLFAVAVPLLAAALVTLALLARDGGQGAGPLAWGVVVLLFGFTALALLTIGIFLLPTTVCLLVACAQHNAGVKG